ncbi:MAG TPA: hypothetical protein GX735_00635 [Firmicutes bacterium]|nr:hypothetical protein [Bacillota bacterium]
MKDCFAYKPGSCSALKVKRCEGCWFYKTKDQFEIARFKALERIYSLPPLKRKYIFKTYYSGGEKI